MILRRRCHVQESALKVARAGLARMYETFEFVQSDGKVLKLGEALKTVKGSFEMHTIRGTRAKPVRPEIKVPYKCYHTGEYKELSGAALEEQVCVTVDRFRGMALSRVMLECDTS